MSALVLFLTALRLFEVSHYFEMSLRVFVAGMIGIGSAWSMATALGVYHLHPSHVAMLVSGAAWVGQALWRNRNAPLRHPGRRRTDLGELDTFATRDKK